MKIKSLFITTVVILGLTFTTLAQTVPSYVPTNGLVGWWPFNGNANDESGGGNHGTVNGATLTTDRFGNTNKAYSFDGASNFIEIDSLNNMPYTPVTYSAWVLINSFLNNSSGFSASAVVGRDKFGQYNQGLICLANEPSSGMNNDFHYYIGNPQTPDVAKADTFYATNTWINIVFQIDELGNFKWYINSALTNSGNLSISQFANLPFRIGSSVNRFYWDGKIDDIGIWNRVLTQQEINDLYYNCQLLINTQPVNQTVNINSSAQFIVGSSDTNTTYQWQTDLGVGFQNLNNVGQYSGVKNDTLTISNVTMSNNNQPFRCIISSGNCSDTSNVAVLTVNNNVGINRNVQDNLFFVFPNPAQSVINFKADTRLIGKSYSIYDNTGRVVLTGKLKSENPTIEVDNLSGGIYLIIVGENMKQTFKIIKSK